MAMKLSLLRCTLLASAGSVLVALSSCASRPVPTLIPQERFAVVLAWMECDECYNYELDHVVSLGAQMRSTLEEARRGRGAFRQVLDRKRDHYFVQGARVAAKVNGWNPRELTASRAAEVERFAREYANHFVAGDLKRYAARADAALARLGVRPEASR